MTDTDQRTNGMRRREALQRMAAAAGASAFLPTAGCFAFPAAAAVAPDMPMAGEAENPSLGAALPPDPSLSSKDWKPKFFDEHQNETVAVLSDLIIPETDTPGAKAVQANRFIDLLLSAEEAETQKEHIEALGWLDGYCLSKYSKPFVRLNREEQTNVLTLLTYSNENPHTAEGVKMFQVIKRSIVQAYYTSEAGMLQELKYQTNPYQPDFPGCKGPSTHN